MLVAKNISKHFSGVKALTDINLELHPGKVNAIIGENGAGKSTLMKILSGVYTQYEGEIVYFGQPVKFSNAKEAEASGISIMHQELNLVPYLSVAENIFLGREITNAWGMLDKKKMAEETARLLAHLHLKVSPAARVGELRVGQQQLIEIARALYSNATVIIMDEPTSAISDKEVDHLFTIIDQLRKEGKIIVYISHKLKELFTIADRFIVLRDGCTVDAGEMCNISHDGLIEKMTGRVASNEKRTEAPGQKEELLCVKDVCLRHPVLPQSNILNNISFNLYKGEILGVYGLMGAGRTELVETIFGLHPRSSTGEISINGTPTKIKSPVDAVRAGIALVPEDRKLKGLVLDQTVRSNMSITILDRLQRLGIMLDNKKEKALADHYVASLSIKTPSINALVGNLSGGNQQKVVLAKWLATHPKILLLDEPTRGIDIKAKQEIYQLMKQLAAEGIGIIMVSSELPEILAVSDRVLVMCKGELSATITTARASEAEILKFAIHKN